MYELHFRRPLGGPGSPSLGSRTGARAVDGCQGSKVGFVQHQGPRCCPQGTQCQGGEKARRGRQRGAAPRPGEWESPFDEPPGQLPCMAQFEELPSVPVNSRCTEPPGAGEGPQLLQDFTTSASKFAHPWPKPTRLSALSFGVPPKEAFQGPAPPAPPKDCGMPLLGVCVASRPMATRTLCTPARSPSPALGHVCRPWRSSVQPPPLPTFRAGMWWVY